MDEIWKDIRKGTKVCTKCQKLGLGLGLCQELTDALIRHTSEKEKC